VLLLFYFNVLYFQVNQFNKVEIDIQDDSVVFVVNQRTVIIHIDGRNKNNQSEHLSNIYNVLISTMSNIYNV
jgi:predicted GNAT family N-acyltransferase